MSFDKTVVDALHKYTGRVIQCARDYPVSVAIIAVLAFLVGYWAG